MDATNVETTETTETKSQKNSENSSILEDIKNTLIDIQKRRKATYRKLCDINERHR